MLGHGRRRATCSRGSILLRSIRWHAWDRLNASVSKKPGELAPVRPVLEFDMVDKRFVEETDVLSGLDKRPNLMDLTPYEFESLIQNLVHQDGFGHQADQSIPRWRCRLRGLRPSPHFRRQGKSSKPSATAIPWTSPPSGICSAPCRTKALPRVSWSPRRVSVRRATSSPRTNLLS